jgi:tRNA threonylcarbamoyladenosine biosynthesis protein TsaE
MVEDLGFDDYLVAGGTVVIEWAERADGYLPAEYLAVRFSRQHENKHSENWRILEFEPRGSQYRDLLERMIAHANPGD